MSTPISTSTNTGSPILAGLCSVTLRSQPIAEVIKLADSCELTAIEWGADVHVPPGDTRAARAARASDAQVVSYGSYLLTQHIPADDDIAVVLDTAIALRASNVRVWTPFTNPPERSGAANALTIQRPMVIEALQRIAAAAAERSLTISLEYHGGTLTASAVSTVAVLNDVDIPNLFTYWQPPYWQPRTDAEDLALIGPRLSHLHLYEWDNRCVRFPLVNASHTLVPLLRDARRTPCALSTPRVAFLEFVRDDDIEQLRNDASTLRTWLEAS